MKRYLKKLAFAGEFFCAIIVGAGFMPALLLWAGTRPAPTTMTGQSPSQWVVACATFIDSGFSHPLFTKQNFRDTMARWIRNKAKSLD